MHRLFSLFIVLLLVFRGLLGDAMAMGNVAAPPGPAHSAGASHDMAGAGHAAHAASAAHGTHTQLPGPGEACAAQDAGGCEHAHGAACAACGICHSALSLGAFVLRVPEAVAGIRPAGLSPRFVSALALQAVKPPIS